jgi:hypothetical protein
VPNNYDAEAPNIVTRGLLPKTTPFNGKIHHKKENAKLQIA